MFFFFQAEDGIRDLIVTGVQTCALPISSRLPAFRCEPAVLHQGDTLHLIMPRAHGGELGVYTPSGRFLYVVPFQAGSALPQNRGRSFAYQPSWTLRVASATASPSPAGAREPIFT